MLQNVDQSHPVMDSGQLVYYYKKVIYLMVFVNYHSKRDVFSMPYCIRSIDISDQIGLTY